MSVTGGGLCLSSSLAHIPAFTPKFFKHNSRLNSGTRIVEFQIYYHTRSFKNGQDWVVLLQYNFCTWLSTPPSDCSFLDISNHEICFVVIASMKSSEPGNMGREKGDMSLLPPESVCKWVGAPFYLVVLGNGQRICLVEINSFKCRARWCQSIEMNGWVGGWTHEWMCLLIVHIIYITKFSPKMENMASRTKRKEF